MSRYFYLICLAVFILAYSCANEKKQTQLTQHKQDPVQHELDNKLILFPGDSTLSQINSPKNLSTLLSENSFKIVNYLDAGCSSCVYELTETQAFSNSLSRQKMAVPFIIIMTGAPKANIDYIVTDQAHLKLPVFYDKDGVFFKMNSLPENKVYQTFLLDKENRVVFAGSPVKEHSFVKEYERIIDSIQQKM